MNTPPELMHAMNDRRLAEVARTSAAQETVPKPAAAHRWRLLLRLLHRRTASPVKASVRPHTAAPSR